MLHMKGSNRLVWKSERAGEAVAGLWVRRRHRRPAKTRRKRRCDSRKEGRIFRAPDFRGMAYLDLEAVKDFLYQEHQAKRLNMRKTAIVAAEMSCLVAAVFAYLDWMKKPHSDAPNLAARHAVRAGHPGGRLSVSPSESAWASTRAWPITNWGGRYSTWPCWSGTDETTSWTAAERKRRGSSNGCRLIPERSRGCTSKITARSSEAPTCWDAG